MPEKVNDVSRKSKLAPACHVYFIATKAILKPSYQKLHIHRSWYQHRFLWISDPKPPHKKMGELGAAFAQIVFRHQDWRYGQHIAFPVQISEMPAISQSKCLQTINSTHTFKVFYKNVSEITWLCQALEAPLFFLFFILAKIDEIKNQIYPSVFRTNL